VVTLTTGRSA